MLYRHSSMRNKRGMFDDAAPACVVVDGDRHDNKLWNFIFQSDLFF